MDDLISRQTAQRLFAKALTYQERVGRYKWTTAEAKQWIADFIEDLPSAQPEIIRCKDCKKYDMHDHRCKHWNHGVVVMDWCSKAEGK